MSVGEIIILVLLLGVIGWNLKNHKAKERRSNPGNPPSPEELEATLKAYKEWAEEFQNQRKNK